MDLAVRNVENNKVSVENVGGFAIPFDINIVYTDNSTETIHQTPAVWENNLKLASIELKAKKQIKQISLDGGIFMDATPSNNTWSVK